MPSADYPYIAREGLPFMVGWIGFMAVAANLFSGWLIVPLVLGLVALILLFRDPRRSIPAAPLAVLSPVDGRILTVEPVHPGILPRDAIRIVLRVNNFGAYTARCPIEGKVLDPRDNLADHSRWREISGMWVRSDEEDDVVVLFHGPRRFGAPRAFTGYGERLGQGHRFAYIRLARSAEIYVPSDARIRIEPGDRVRAGTDILAELRHR